MQGAHAQSRGDFYGQGGNNPRGSTMRLISSSSVRAASSACGPAGAIGAAPHCAGFALPENQTARTHARQPPCPASSQARFTSMPCCGFSTSRRSFAGHQGSRAQRAAGSEPASSKSLGTILCSVRESRGSRAPVPNGPSVATVPSESTTSTRSMPLRQPSPGAQLAASGEAPPRPLPAAPRPDSRHRPASRRPRRDPGSRRPNRPRVLPRACRGASAPRGARFQRARDRRRTPRRAPARERYRLPAVAAARPAAARHPGSSEPALRWCAQGGRKTAPRPWGACGDRTKTRGGSWA